MARSTETKRRQRAQNKLNRAAKAEAAAKAALVAEAEAEHKAFVRKYRAEKESEKLFSEAKGLRSKKRKKTTDAIVEHGEGIVYEKDGRTPKRHKVLVVKDVEVRQEGKLVVLKDQLVEVDGEIVTTLNARKGPSGKTRPGKNKTVGCSPRSELTAQNRLVEYQETVCVVAANHGGAGGKAKVYDCKDGSKAYRLVANAQSGINKGLAPKGAVKKLPKVEYHNGKPYQYLQREGAKAATSLKGNPATKPVSVNPEAKPLNDKRKFVPSKEVQHLERDYNRFKPVPIVERNAPASPPKRINGAWDANEDLAPWNKKRK